MRLYRAANEQVNWDLGSVTAPTRAKQDPKDPATCVLPRFYEDDSDNDDHNKEKPGGRPRAM